jgi:RimJ/RimL family protein N-acetyltransferase
VPSLVGVIRELFDERGLKKINMTVFRRNHAISGLLRFIGAKLEGEIRRVYLQHGKLLDTKIWGLIPEDLEVAFRDNPKLEALCAPLEGEA